MPAAEEMNTQLLDSEKQLIESSLSDFDRTFRSKSSDQERLEFLSASLKNFVNASPRLRLALSQSLHSKNNTNLFRDTSIKVKALHSSLNCRRTNDTCVSFQGHQSRVRFACS